MHAGSVTTLIPTPSYKRLASAEPFDQNLDFSTR